MCIQQTIQFNVSLINSYFADPSLIPDDNPKSDNLAVRSVVRRTFRAAKSPCTMFFSFKYAMPLAICKNKIRLVNTSYKISVRQDFG